MRERHNWATRKHPRTCTCASCQQRRAEAAAPRPKKKRKPKSQRGHKGRKLAGEQQSSALDEALDIFGFGKPVETDEDEAGSEPSDK